jgi:hypothetical protein
MNFQDFCNTKELVDEQVVSINNTFVISFGKPGGTSFNIDPADIKTFLEFLSINHDSCRKAIESDARFTAESFVNYQEKPYRALYKLTESEEQLNTIRSLGGSQTKELTKVISKLVSFLAEIPYVPIQENTNFDKDSIDRALSNLPENLRELNAKEVV